MSILVDLEKLLLNDIAVGIRKKTFEPEENLLENGVLDSLGIMKLTVAMEERFGIEVDDEEIVPENFQNLASMTRFVEQKLLNK